MRAFLRFHVLLLSVLFLVTVQAQDQEPAVISIGTETVSVQEDAVPTPAPTPTPTPLPPPPSAPAVTTHSDTRVKTGQVSFVLLGATGSLAKKYLWQALFDMHVASYPSPPLVVFAAARAKQEEGELIVQSAIDRLNCYEGALQLIADGADCASLRRSFASSVTYSSLRSDADYASLNTLILRRNPTETGRVYYFSIVPKAYTAVAASIAANALPSSRAWVRLVVEKPIGHSSESAEALLKALHSDFKPEQTLLVDHYLSTRVRPIVEFRDAVAATNNPEQASMSRIDVVMSESESVEDRTWFYNDVGVIRDVLQNHATEMFLHTVSHISHGQIRPGDRVEALGRLTADLHSAICPLAVGQYDLYSAHAVQDGSIPAGTSIKTPTAARIPLLYQSRARSVGSNTPVFITSGKALSRKEAYVRVSYSNGMAITYLLSGTVGIAHEGGDYGLGDSITAKLFKGSRQWETVTVAADGSRGYSAPPIGVSGPAVLVEPASSSGPKPSFPLGWTVIRDAISGSAFGIPPSPSPLRDSPSSTFNFGLGALSPGGTRAYGALFVAAVENDISMFVSPAEVKALWKLWTPIIDSAAREPVKSYGHGDPSLLVCPTAPSRTANRRHSEL